MNKLLLLVLFCVLFFVSSNSKWYDTGHWTTGKIAQYFINSNVKEKMKKLFNDERLGAQATWADEIKREPQWKFSSSLHYADFHNNSCAFVPRTDCKLPESCVVAGIYNYTQRYEKYSRVSPESNQTKEELKTALRFIIHFLGDIHQPLHIGRAEDLGGNLIHVYFFGHRKNLHQVWDGEILKHRVDKNFNSNQDLFIKYVVEKYTSTEFLNQTHSWLKCSDEKKKICPEEWANESAGIACKNVYQNATEGSFLNETYYEQGFPIIEQQLMKGGIRLAYILNLLLPMIEGGECENSEVVQWWEYILYGTISLFLICFAGLMSGLTLGLLSIDPMQLSVLKSAGSPREKRLAARIEPVISNHHYLLVTLLLMNALAMESLPLFLDKIVPGWLAIAISVSMVLLFGEVIPQAVCARYGLEIGAYLNYFVLFLMAISFPIAFPISLLLDKLLGKDHLTFYRRSQLKEIIDIHGDEENSMEPESGPLSKNEIQLMRGALELHELVVEKRMKKLEDVEMIEIDSKIDDELFEKVNRIGYTRIPVYQKHKKNIIGYLVTKLLIGISSEDNLLISDIRIFDAYYVEIYDDLWTVFHELIKEKKHLGFVKMDDSNDVVGIITIEDILEELLKQDITDEIDDLNENKF